MVVQSLDRLGRSLSEVVRVADELLKRGIVLRTLIEGIDYSTATGRMVAGIFAALAEYERTLIDERTADARAAAKARGKQTGRPRALTADQVALARGCATRTNRSPRSARRSRSPGRRCTGCSARTLRPSSEYLERMFYWVSGLEMGKIPRPHLLCRRRLAPLAS